MISVVEAAPVEQAPLAPRLSVVLIILTAISVAGFVLVSHLVTRYRANTKQIAWHLFQRGVADADAGNLVGALDEFRAALTYDPGNSQYQLSLARALRDSGRLSESQTYLLSLWERAPQDSTISLALARLAVRQHALDTAIRYYHNAIYGIWDRDADSNRRHTRLELIQFLLEENALPQAQAELLSLAQTLPPDPELHLQVAALFARAGDQPHALAEFRQVLHLDRRNHAALAGAGETAFQLRRYDLAQHFLKTAVETDSGDAPSQQLLGTVNLLLGSDPFRPRISDAERNRRLQAAFEQAGHRLQSCATSLELDLASPSANGLHDLSVQWNELKPKLRQLRSAGETDLPDIIMDLVSTIEQKTAQRCGPPKGMDLALSLISHQAEAE
ncbi:MAG TPA: tetratricopeptide repeat protein [Terriglobales bacterium]|nr:tetratricopeptide repeat protein [Terriglobales bacterium]